MGKQDELEILQRLGRIGAQSAAESLKLLLKKKVDCALPNVNIVPAGSLSEIFDKQESPTAVYVTTKGEMRCVVAALFGRDDTLRLVDALTGKKKGTTLFIGEYNQSVVKEVGNILANTYLNALAKLFKFTATPDAPNIVFNVAETGLDLGKAAGITSKYVIVVENKFKIGEISVEGSILFFLCEECVEKVLGSDWAK